MAINEQKELAGPGEALARFAEQESYGPFGWVTCERPCSWDSCGEPSAVELSGYESANDEPEYEHSGPVFVAQTATD